jgi:phosphate transport system ATP-binding protein
MPCLYNESYKYRITHAFQEEKTMVADTIIKVSNLISYHGEVQALKGINIDVYKYEILGIIGPANSGKTTFLRALNRLNNLNIHYRQEGEIIFDNQNIKEISDELLRKRIGIIFAMPQVLPVSIYNNVAYGPKVHGFVKTKADMDSIVEDSLRKAYLWDEVKDRLNLMATRLSGGQQQRLCIARTLAAEPEVILYDEPCSGLDPISTAKVEEAMQKLKESYTQILVTNNTKQAARVSERCGFFLMGELVEISDTTALFMHPQDKRTEDYVTGRFG